MPVKLTPSLGTERAPRVIIFSFSFKRGGAGIAAERVAGLAETKYNVVRVSPEGVVNGGVTKNGAITMAAFFLKRLLSYALVKLQWDRNPIKHSLNLFSAPGIRKHLIRAEQSGDLCHFHWINNDVLSIFYFDELPLSSIVSLHDEWIYCGAEHCARVVGEDHRYRTGYRFFDRAAVFNWNYIIWSIKKRKLKPRDDIIYTVPSRWMLERARKSQILKNKDIRLLPNCIDTKAFKPVDVTDFKVKLGIADTDIVLGLPAFGGRNQYLKGITHLEDALNILRLNLPDETADRLKIITLGGKAARTTVIARFETFELGFLSGHQKLSVAYSAADIFIVPSLVESFGQMAAEALACATPLVCFDSSGLKDIVLHGKCGLRATAFSPKDLAGHLERMIKMTTQERTAMGQAGRTHIQKNFSSKVIEQAYQAILDEAFSQKKTDSSASSR